MFKNQIVGMDELEFINDNILMDVKKKVILISDLFLQLAAPNME